MPKQKFYILVLASLATLLVFSWGLMDALEVKGKERLRWQNIMAEVATSDASQVEAWLATFANQTQRLADDPRIRHLLATEDEPQNKLEVLANAKRALVEFNVLFGAKFIYLFNADSSANITLEGSPKLGVDTLTAMATTFEAKMPTYQPLIRGASVGYLGTALPVVPKTGMPLGYVMAVYLLDAGLERLGSPASSDKGTKRYILRLDHQGRPQALSWPKDDMPKDPVVVSKTPAQWPVEASRISEPLPSQAPFIDLDGTPIYAWLSESLVDGHWATLSTATPELVYRDVPKKIMLVVLRTVLGLLVVWIGAILLVTSLKKSPFKGLWPRWEIKFNWIKVPLQNLLKRLEKSSAPPTPRMVDTLQAREEELFSHPAEVNYVSPPPLRQIEWPDDAPPTPERMAHFVKDSLQHERLRLYYQPIVDLSTDKPAMFETLLRLTDEKNNLVMPPDFLPAAKQFDLLKEVDDAVLLASIRKHTQLQMHGKLLTLSINLSETAFRNENFMQQFTDGVKARRIIPAYLVFEVSSDALLKDNKAMKFVRDMQYMGCRFAIDYFGGGTKAVDAVRSLGFDYMKINALRFDDIDSNPENLKTFHDVIAAAKASKVAVIVEKVETQLMYRLCEKLGVPYVQGFFIAPPAPKFSIN